MMRFLFSAGAVFVLVLSMCLLPRTASARRCGTKEPETLLSLYQNSDAIYIAAFDKIVEGKVVESNDDYTVNEIEKHFTISSTLKGQSRKFLVLGDREYKYPNAVVESDSEDAEEVAGEGEEVAGEEEEETDDEPLLKSGDTMLLFVNEGDGEEPPSLTDYRDGIKKLTAAEISVYEARVKDLDSIFSAKKVSDARLLEWLIRCAEDPVTRWEGTFELLQSVRKAEWSEQAAERRRDRIANGLPVEEEAVEEEVPEGEQAEADVKKNVDTSVFAKMLDANHKYTLANLLLNEVSANAPPADGESEEKKAVAGDSELIELVKRWGDPRLMGFLLDKLRNRSEEPGYAAETMSTIAELLETEQGTAIANEYSAVAYEDAESVVEDESDEEEAVEADKAEPADEPDAEDPAVEPDRNEPADVDADEAVADDKPLPKKLTYAHLRADLLQKFLTHCDQVIAEREKEKDLAAAR